MTAEIEDELLDLLYADDPKHFSPKRSVITWEIAGWCLDQMPKNTIVLFASGRTAYHIYMSDFSGRPAHDESYIGSTRQEAIIRAYCAWARSGFPGMEK